jgi:predicted acyltransferase
MLALFDRVFDRARMQDRSQLMAAVLWPMRVLGVNALAAFLLSGFLAKTLFLLPAPDGTDRSLATWTYKAIFATDGSTPLSSLMFAGAFCVLSFLPLWALWKKKIIVKV